MKLNKAILTLAICSLASAAAMAQKHKRYGTGHTAQHKPAERIEQGLQSGPLTTREAGRLERQETSVEKMENRAMHDGTVSAVRTTPYQSRPEPSQPGHLSSETRCTSRQSELAQFSPDASRRPAQCQSASEDRTRRTVRPTHESRNRTSGTQPSTYHSHRSPSGQRRQHQRRRSRPTPSAWKTAPAAASSARNTTDIPATPRSFYGTGLNSIRIAK